MKKNYEKPMIVSDKKKKNEIKVNQKPMYLADGRWCCKVPGIGC